MNKSLKNKNYKIKKTIKNQNLLKNNKNSQNKNKSKTNKKKKIYKIKHKGGQILPTTCSDFSTDMCKMNFGCRQPFWAPNCR